MSRMKYVRFEKAGIVIVESQVKHNEVISPFGSGDTAISAGFFNVQDADDVGLYGESESLKLTVGETDLPRLQRNLRGY